MFKIQIFKKKFIASFASVLILFPAAQAQQKSQAESGRLVDHLYKNQKVPNDFEMLLNDLSGKLEAQYKSPVLVLREGFDGRSLDQDHDSPQSPREIAVFTMNSQRRIPLMFLGFAPKKGRLENIVFEPGKGWNFSLAAPMTIDTKGKPILVGRTENGFCSSCHQAEAPIFSRFPWNESRGANKDNVFSDSKSLRTPEETNLSEFAKPTSAGGIQPFSFDGDVRTANKMAQDVQVCNTICKTDDVDCRIRMLSLTLANPIFQRGKSYKELSTWTQKIAKEWPKNQFAYASSVLPDRNLTAGQEGSISFFIPDDSVSNEEFFSILYGEDKSASTLESAAGIRFVETPLPGYRGQLRTKSGQEIQHPGNPQTPRPLINPIGVSNFFDRNEKDKVLVQANGLNPSKGSYFPRIFIGDERSRFSCFGLSSEDKMEFEKISSRSDIDPLSDEGQTYLLKNAKLREAIARKAVGAELRTALMQAVPDYECKTCGFDSVEPFAEFYMVKKQREGMANVARAILNAVDAKKRVEKLAGDHCSTCHDDSSPIKLPLNNAADLAKYKSRLGKTPAERINDQEMPPADHRSKAEKLNPDYESELAELAALLQSLKTK